MKYFKEHIDEFSKIYFDDENYILFNDGKPIREHFLTENDIEVSLDERLDCKDICDLERNNDEKELIDKTNFNVHIKIHNDLSLKIIHLNDDEKYVSFSFELDPKVEVKIIDIYTRTEIDAQILNEVLVKNRARLDYFVLTRCEGKVNFHSNFYLDKQCNVNLYSLNLNENEFKHTENVYLYDRFSKLNEYNAIVNNTKYDQEYSYNVHNLSSSCISKMYNNAICNCEAFITVNTDGIIKKGATETDLSQKIKGILLDKKSNIIANPILEIDEYDCKASHGASVGAVDDSDLFYLMSRGITRNDAIKLIVYSYIETALVMLSKDEKSKNLIKYIEKIVNKKL